MSLTVDEVRHVAMLSRLHLSDEEVRRYAQQLGAILEYVDQLKELNTDSIEPMITATASGNVFRKDEPRPGLERDAALAAAPQQDGEFFLVPKVIE
ncbi:MAG: Asp-tRNA(Asn)/Glu-tRNA(Gln) amidotransferase subunit GatC [Planctomycetota bacterium]|nr:Asp-tRNA(Asn)/Glu-tRNA(Gln) amidotransferase subunit GatC [Planctomycetota bacterium]